MKLKLIQIHISEIELIRRLPGSWNPAAFRKLLDVVEFNSKDTLTDDEVEELAVMSLQDMEAEEAMKTVLTHFTDNLFSKGQIQNL